MPIDLRTHDPDDGIDIAPGTNKAEIVELLYSNPNLGFKPAEIHDRLDMPKGSVTTTLLRLHEEGYVGKTADGYYHAVASRDDLRRFARGLVQASQLTRRYADDEFSPEDVEQTGESPPKRDSGGTESPPGDEPTAEDWIEDVDE